MVRRKRMREQTHRLEVWENMNITHGFNSLLSVPSSNLNSLNSDIRILHPAPTPGLSAFSDVQYGVKEE